jgi:glycerophosphoryl diester phosphodiesterase
MAAWTILVWAAIAVVLGPLSSALLGWQALRGPRAVVGNEEILAWVLTWQGGVWVLLAGSMLLTGAVVRYAGLFHILMDHLEGRPVTVAGTALRLAVQVPALFRLALAGVAGAVVMAIPLLAGLAAVRAVLVSAHDINYYLSERPPEWVLALTIGAGWFAVWATAAGYWVGRGLLVVPAYLDGHRPFRAALARARERGRGEKRRLLRVLGAAVAVWLGSRVAITAGYLAAGALAVGWATALSDSLRLMVLVVGAYVAGLFALDAIIAFLGFAFAATVLTKFYLEDTDLHSLAPPPPRLADLPVHAVDGAVQGARRWLRPRRIVPLLAGVAVVSVVVSVLILHRMPEPRPVLVTAHRAGPPPSPENTLAALERAIQAGADFAEIDVLRTRDGVVVVAHDADLMRVAGDRRRIAASSYVDLAGVVKRPDDGSPPEERRLATLEQFLDRSRDRIGLNIELKYYGPDPTLAPAVVRAVRAASMEDQVVLMSLSADAVMQLSRLAPELSVGYVAAATVGDPARLPVSFLALSRQQATPRAIRAARARGLEVHVWTVNRADAMAELIERGVDGLITDDPALAVRIRRELAGLPPAARLLLRAGWTGAGRSAGEGAELVGDDGQRALQPVP